MNNPGVNTEWVFHYAVLPVFGEGFSGLEMFSCIRGGVKGRVSSLTPRKNGARKQATAPTKSARSAHGAIFAPTFQVFFSPKL